MLNPHSSIESRTISTTFLVLVQEMFCLYHYKVDFNSCIQCNLTVFQTFFEDALLSHFSEKGQTVLLTAGLSELGHLYLLDCNEDASP